MSSNQNSKIWDPAKYALGRGHLLSKQSSRYAVVILNQPLENKEVLVKLCAGAIFIACADGGANRLKDLCLEGQEERDCHPNAICGDMDSIRPEVEKHYRELGTRIIKDPDQYSTDLKKCLKHISEQDISAFTEGQKISHKSGTLKSHASEVVMIGGLGGRADQAFSLLHQLYRNYEDRLTDSDLYLIIPESIIFLLEKGDNTVHTPIGAGLLTKHVGIIPIGRPSVISTRGLEWDVKDWHTEFGTQVSTSNHVVNDMVNVHTTERVLFSVGLQKLDTIRQASVISTASFPNHVS